MQISKGRLGNFLNEHCIIHVCCNASENLKRVERPSFESLMVQGLRKIHCSGRAFVLLPAESVNVSPRRRVKINTDRSSSLNQKLPQMFDVSSSLQIHVSDRPYNSMSRTLGLTRATEIGSRRLTTNAENLSKKNENKNVKKWIFKNNRLYSEFFESFLRAT